MEATLRSARSRWRRRAAVLAAGTLAVATAAVVTPATAGTGWSTACNDSPPAVHDDVPIAGGPHALVPNTPFTLGIEVNTTDHGGVRVALCYSTNGYNDPSPALLGGNLAVDVATVNGYSNPTGNEVNLACLPDTNTQGLYCNLGLDAAYVAGGTGGGQALTFRVPYAVCFGANCLANSAVGPTGVVVGTLTAGPGGVNLSSLTVYVAGVPVTVGSTGGGTSSGAITASPAGGIPVCVTGFGCTTVPLGAYVAGNGAAIVYVDVAGQHIPLNSPSGCIVGVNATPPC
ncbi:MAG TPA: hypothetical protein VF230_02970 [Acidimicrobiales bacterium]